MPLSDPASPHKRRAPHRAHPTQPGRCADSKRYNHRHMPLSFGIVGGRMNLKPDRTNRTRHSCATASAARCPPTHRAQSVGLYSTTHAPREVFFSCGCLPPPFTPVDRCLQSSRVVATLHGPRCHGSFIKRSIVTSRRPVRSKHGRSPSKTRAVQPPASPIATDSQQLPRSPPSRRSPLFPWRREPVKG